MRQAYDYWQDQPGNCPTRTAPTRDTARGSGYRGSRPFPGQSKSPTDSSRPPSQTPPDTAPYRTLRPAAPRSEFLVPRSHTPREHFPQSCGLESGTFGEDYRRAAAPLYSRGLPERGGSPSGSLRTELAIGYQIHLPLHRSQQRQRRSAKLTSPGSSGFLTVARLESQATIPSQAGTSCKAGASTARSRDGQPSLPSSGSNRHRKQTPGRSRRRSSRRSQHPDATSLSPAPPKHTDIRASVLTTAAFKAAAAQLAPRVKGRPVPRLRGVKGRPVSPSLAHGHRTPPSISPRIQHPWKSCTPPMLTLHVVGKAHFYQHVGSNVPGG